MNPRINPEINQSLEPLILRVHDFVVARERACLRDIYLGLNEKPGRVDECLRRLYSRGYLLRTKQPVYRFETVSRGRASIVSHTRAIKYYAANDGRDLPVEFVKYENRPKDGRCKGVESKQKQVLAFLKDHSNQAFYSKRYR